MSGQRLFAMLLVIGLLIALFAVGIALAATAYDLTTAGSTATINGAIFEAFTADDPNGEGTFEHFVRLTSDNSVIRGYNTDYRPVQYEEDDSSLVTLARLLSEVPQVDVSGVLHREFQLDINQDTTAEDYLLSLDEVELYESTYPDLCGHPFDGSGGGHTGCTSNNTATLIWDMDGLEDSFVVLDHRNNDSPGRRDMRLLVPDSAFNQAPDCVYEGVGCTIYISIYSQFGNDEVCPRSYPAATTCPNNDGYEDWGVKVPGPTAVTLGGFMVDGVNERFWLAWAAVGLLVIGTGILLLFRRQQ